MKVLMLSGDRNLLDPNTEAHKRFVLQTSQVEQLDLFVWPQVHPLSVIWRAARKGHYDVITTQDPFWRGLIGWFFTRRTGARLNVQVHTDLDAQPLIRHMLAQIVLRHADSVRVVSEKLKVQVLHIAPSKKVSVLPVYTNISAFRSVVRQPEGSVLWVGRFEDEKDPLLALEILKELPNTKLVMLGKGSLEGQLRKRAEGLIVEFPGWQNPVAYLARASVVLCTSKHESYGASIVEALAAGVPVVAPDVGVAKEAGAIVVPHEQLAEKVIEVLKSGQRGELKLPILSEQEWAEAWPKTLI